VSSLHPLSMAVITDNAEIYARRAKPMMEYLMSREKYLFSSIKGVTGQSPSHAMRGPAAEVQVIVDGSDFTYGNAIVNYTTAIARTVSAGGLRTGMPVEVRERFLYNPDLEGSHFIVPGVVAIVLMMVCALLTSITIAREKETGTMDVLLVSPVRSHEIILGKVIPYIGLALVDAVIILVCARLIFDVPFRGNLLLLTWCTVAYVYAALSLGLLISSNASTQLVAMMAAMVATILPSMVLSGFIFSIFSMPAPIRAITWAIPARHYITIIRSILLKGGGLTDITVSIVALLIIGTVFVLAATLRFAMKGGR